MLLASKIIAAFKISVLHKWLPEGFLPKEFSFHGQLSSYASGRKNGTLTQLQHSLFSLRCEGIRFDSPTLFLFSSSFCGQWFWLCGDYISGFGGEWGHSALCPVALWPSLWFFSITHHSLSSWKTLSLSPLNGIDLSLSCSLGLVQTVPCLWLNASHL